MSVITRWCYSCSIWLWCYFTINGWLVTVLVRYIISDAFCHAGCGGNRTILRRNGTETCQGTLQWPQPYIRKTNKTHNNFLQITMRRKTCVNVYIYIQMDLHLCPKWLPCVPVLQRYHDTARCSLFVSAGFRGNSRKRRRLQRWQSNGGQNQRENISR